MGDMGDMEEEDGGVKDGDMVIEHHRQEDMVGITRGIGLREYVKEDVQVLEGEIGDVNIQDRDLTIAGLQPIVMVVDIKNIYILYKWFVYK